MADWWQLLLGGGIVGVVLKWVLDQLGDRAKDRRTDARALAARNADHLAELERAVGQLEQWQQKVVANTAQLEDHHQAIEAVQSGLVAMRERLGQMAKTQDLQELGRHVAELRGRVDGLLARLRGER